MKLVFFFFMASFESKMDSPTRSDEHDIILAILCLHSVHHQLGELVVHICPHHDGAPADWVHWVVHGWVTPGEGDDIIGEVFGGVKPSERLAGTLSLKEIHNYAFVALI